MSFLRDDDERRSSLVLVAGPTARPITLEEVKLHLAVEHDDHDAMIDQLIDAAIAHLDGRDGWLGRALVEQTWELRLDAFPPCIVLPLPPLIAVESIEYLDPDGVLQTLDVSQYQVEAGGFQKALITRTSRAAWPHTKAEKGCVRITFRCGYALASEDSPAVVEPGVPPPLVTTIKFHVELLYGREPDRAALLQQTADALASGFRIWS